MLFKLRIEDGFVDLLKGFFEFKDSVVIFKKSSIRFKEKRRARVRHLCTLVNFKLQQQVM